MCPYSTQLFSHAFARAEHTHTYTFIEFHNYDTIHWLLLRFRETLSYHCHITLHTYNTQLFFNAFVSAATHTLIQMEVVNDDIIGIFLASLPQRR